jgi:hypothetical protein
MIVFKITGARTGNVAQWSSAKDLNSFPSTEKIKNNEIKPGMVVHA